MIKSTVLIIEDEAQLQKLLRLTLESSEYKVLIASTAREGIALVSSFTPDLILLDIGLPDMSGLELLKRLREWYNRGIIILTAQHAEESIVQALDNGASDYLTKPYRSAELLARIRAVLRRNQQPSLETALYFDDLELSLTNRVVKKDGEAVKLTATEYQLLHTLAINEGRVLTHRFLLKEVWGVGQQNETQYLRVFIGNLRKKLENNPNKPKHILTESGVGYRFV